MRCKKHPRDYSSSVGVCASCLRQRLFSLIAAQQQLQQQPTDDDLSPLRLPIRGPKIRLPPPPLLLQHSPGGALLLLPQDYQNNKENKNKKTKTKTKTKTKIPLFSHLILFLSRSEKSPSPHPVIIGDDPISSSPHRLSSSSSSSSKDPPEPSRSSRILDHHHHHRGMSPVRDPDYSSDAFKMTPSTRRHHHARSSSSSLSSFCLSPLVWASPLRSLHPPKGSSSDSADLRPSRLRLSSASTFCTNRSRKLADFGRVTPNR